MPILLLVLVIDRETQVFKIISKNQTVRPWSVAVNRHLVGNISNKMSIYSTDHSLTACFLEVTVNILTLAVQALDKS